MLSLKLENRKIVIYHGEEESILDALIASHLYDIVLTGHTHTIRNEIIDDVLLVNPGTTCYAANGGIVDFASIAILDISTKSATIVKF